MPGKFDYLLQYSWNVNPDQPVIRVDDVDVRRKVDMYRDPTAPIDYGMCQEHQFIKDSVILQQGVSVRLPDFLSVLENLQAWLWEQTWSKRADATVITTDPVMRIRLDIWVEDRDHIRAFMEYCKSEFDRVESK